MTRPSIIPDWCTAGTRADPGSAIRASGAEGGKRHPAPWYNWLIGHLCDWIAFLDAFTSTNASVKRTSADAAQVVADETITDVLFVSSEYDEAGFWNSDPAECMKFTAAAAGRYRVTANIIWNAFTPGTCSLQILRGDGANFGYDTRNLTIAFLTGSGMTTTATVDLGAGDYVKAQVRQDTGGDMSIVVARMQIERVG